MKIIKDNIWTYHKKDSYIVITTNGFVKKNGECVMGRGIAQQARDRFPGFDKKLGSAIKKEGNKVFVWTEETLITFPVKHNWWEKSDLELIKTSSQELAKILKNFNVYSSGSPFSIYMPKPGCDNGRLDWKDVEPIINNNLSNLVTLVDWK